MHYAKFDLEKKSPKAYDGPVSQISLSVLTISSHRLTLTYVTPPTTKKGGATVVVLVRTTHYLRHVPGLIKIIDFSLTHKTARTSTVHCDLAGPQSRGASLCP